MATSDPSFPYSSSTQLPPRLIKWLLLVGAIIAVAYLAFQLYLIGLPLFGLLILLLGLGLLVVYGRRQFYAARFIYPGIVTVCLFILFPIAYTIFLGFTNYSSFNLLTAERATKVLLQDRSIDITTERPFAILPAGEQFRLFFPITDADDTADSAAEAPVNQLTGGYLTTPLTLDGNPVTVAVTTTVAAVPENLLSIREVIALRQGIAAVAVTMPDGTVLRATGLRNFAKVTYRFKQLANARLLETQTGKIYQPNQNIGFYVDSNGEPIAPGWRVTIGWANFAKIFTSQAIREPFLRIFIWTFVFAAASVVTTFTLGVALASCLQWEHLRGKMIYRILLILPYAVPAFISILIFRGLFNPNFGEINLILESLFGIRPEWWSHPWLARTMILIVNTWLGYPYMMLLAMGFLQAVPEEQKKAAVLEGATPLQVFFAITLPQILPPFLPLLLASFAFNFNNLVLIWLLTKGGPDMAGTLIPAGHSDILASFMYRIAFDDSGQQFGLASAITLIIFLLITVIAYSNFRILRKSI